MPLLFFKLRKAALEQDAAPLLLSGLLAAVLALCHGGLSPSTSCLLAVVMALQVVLKLYGLLYEKALPIERLEHAKHGSSANYSRLALGLAALPLLNVFNGYVGWLALVLVSVLLALPLCRLFVRLLHKESLGKQHLTAVKNQGALIAVHVAGSEGATTAYQINQWLPVLEKLNVPTMILLRDRELFPDMHATTLAVVYARNARHVEQILDTGVRTVLYPANPMKNLQLFRHYRINHFFINHGESDKAVNQSKLLMAYDKILVGGPMAEKRLVKAGLPVRPGQVVHVGRPQAEMLLKTKEGRGGTIRTILYAPTWEGFNGSVDYSSVGPISTKIFEEFRAASEYKILFKPHPYTGLSDKRRKDDLRKIQKLCEEGGHEFVDASVPIHDLMNRSDLLITDISSVLNEYLVTGKPIVLCIPERMTDIDVGAEYPSASAAYLLKQGDPILALIKRIVDSDPLAGQREEVRRESLGNFEEGALARFKAVVEGSVR